MSKVIQDGVGVDVIEDGIMIKQLITVIEDGKTEFAPEYPLLIEDFDWKNEFGFWKVFGDSFAGWKEPPTFTEVFTEDFSGWE